MIKKIDDILDEKSHEKFINWILEFSEYIIY